MIGSVSLHQNGNSMRIAVAVVLACFSSAAFAQGDVIAQRKDIMKGVGAATRDPGRMLRGEPFDLQKVKAALAVYADAAVKMPGLYPAGSETGGETTAAPKIWQAKADFDARMAKFGADAKAASAAVTDEASFRAEMPKVLQNCGSCHELYRVEKK